jgi:ABC-type antimicrobial peptide transport system permease subunit
LRPGAIADPIPFRAPAIEEKSLAGAVDGGYFAALGVSAQRGRVIGSSDEQTAARVAVLSDDLWRSRFSGKPGAIGRTIRVNGIPFEIVGVASADVIVRSYMQIDVSVLDPWMLILTPIPLVLAALCASYLPAAQAARVDPAVALRAE